MNNGNNSNGTVAKKTTTAAAPPAAAVSSFSAITETLETKTKEQLIAEILELKKMMTFAEDSFARMQGLVDFFDKQNKELRAENAQLHRENGALRKQVHGEYEPIANPRDLQPMERHPLAVITTSEALVDDEDFDEQQLRLAMQLSLQENHAALPPTNSSSSSSSSTTTSLRPVVTAIDPEDSPGLQH